jgi:hypothetical protein
MPKPQQPIRIWWDPALTSYRISSPFSDEFKNRIKGPSIAWQDRGWDAQTRTWVFAEQYFDLVLQWVRELWPAAQPLIKTRLETENESRNILPSGEMSIFAKASIVFVELLDSEALGAAYKSMAKRLHPDAGGDGAKFAEFNSAYQELKKEINGR